MTEYIIIVVLIALAAIVTVTFFGGTVEQQFKSMSLELMGDNGSDDVKQRVNDGRALSTDSNTLQSYGN